ncbi:hypothetical protein OUZ56_032772 [Daphnia magna]|uniref:Uncharacterized protein n=1 Tax=Daphnia magna TaxID=35525 RepID=A0ABQ9ZX37_9CRUS|nr:hypothetical protein OUZ56_032772 [Daphnia magna]
MTGILPIIHQMAHQLPCQALWNPRWTKGLGLTGGEEHKLTRKEIREGVTKIEELLQSYNLKNGDLPLIHKELERKAIEIID